MTNLVPASDTRRVPPPRRGAAHAGALALGLALLFASRPAAAQAPTTPTPPAQPVASAPPLLPPPAVAAPPPAPVAVSRQSVRPSPVLPAARVGLPPDSVRPVTAATVAAVPANAVARCGDGTYLLSGSAANGCAAHGGIRVILPREGTPPPPAATRIISTPAATRAAAASATPPAGATMRCRDGTFLSGAPSDAACAGHSGLAAALMPPRPAPVAPAKVRRP